MITHYDTAWERMPDKIRDRLLWGMWFLTFVGLLAGLFDRTFYDLVVIFSAAHAILVLLLLGLHISAFPVQVRLAYLAWVTIGTYVPHLRILMYITTIGLATNLFLGYCPLARMMYLCPWNREEPISLNFLRRVFLSPPRAGKFTPPPPSG